MASFQELMDIDDSESSEREFKPIWTINLKDKEKLFKWLQTEFTFLMKLNRGRHEEMVENLRIYMGGQFSPDDTKTINDFLDISRRPRRSRNEKLIINHLFDITETIVSRTIRNAPQPEVLPSNSNELSDRNAAKASQQILNYLAFLNRLSMKDVKLKRQSLLFGDNSGFTSLLSIILPRLIF